MCVFIFDGIVTFFFWIYIIGFGVLDSICWMIFFFFVSFVCFVFFGGKLFLFILLFLMKISLIYRIVLVFNIRLYYNYVYLNNNY